MTLEDTQTTVPVRPWHPYLVLASSIVLPGSGHVMNGKPVKAFQFVFFIVLLGWLTTKIAPPQATFIGQHAGGVFVWCLSVLDAYRMARVRWEHWLNASAKAKGRTP